MVQDDEIQYQPLETFQQPSNAHIPRPPYSDFQNINLNWSTDVLDFETHNFDQPIKVLKNYNNRSQPVDYFFDLFSQEMIELLVKNTNIYAKVTNSKNWVEITQSEMKAFLGIMTLMSINPLSDFQLYWSTDEFYNNPVISKVMTLQRFKKITQNLHVSDVRNELPRNSPAYDKLCKVRPLIDALSERFESACAPSQCNSVDESMIKFKGRSVMRQYMPKKPVKRGFKCWARCDSKTGFLHKFQLYTGKMGESAEENLGFRVVLDLSEGMPPGSLLAFDNFFTSIPLMWALHEKGIYSVGTIRIDRKYLPEEIIGPKMNKKDKEKPTKFEIAEHKKKKKRNAVTDRRIYVSVFKTNISYKVERYKGCLRM